jgi:hypothetical protein
MAEQERITYLAQFHNRFVDIKMKGSWGYNRSNATIITAVSWIEELEVTNLKSFDDEGNKLPSQLVIGTDKYGRELEVPVNRMLEVSFLDTKDQSILKGVVSLKQGFANIPKEQIEENEVLKRMMEENRLRYDELLTKGVTLYERRGN